jgi:adenylylsulfate kinase-like enzyme
VEWAAARTVRAQPGATNAHPENIPPTVITSEGDVFRSVVIVLTGPSASGKSTVARELAPGRRGNRESHPAWLSADLERQFLTRGGE